MTRTDKQLNTLFRRAGRAALTEWKQELNKLDDLVADIWVWYLERPATQRKLEGLKTGEAVKTVKKAALQMLRQNTIDDNLFEGKNTYSSESVKDYLSGRSTNEGLKELLSEALDLLAEQNEGRYVAALRDRYSKSQIPSSKKDENLLVRAHQSLTEHVNLIAVKREIDTRNAVDPETRRSKGGGHSDPTGNTALLLMEHPEERESFLEVTYKEDFLGGAGSSVVIELGNGARYRATGKEAQALIKYPELIEPFTQKLRAQLC